MKVQKIQSYINFKKDSGQQELKKPEFIDKFLGVVRNQDDINDCVAVPRGIFKAYLWIMTGFGLIGIANALPQKMSGTKRGLSIVGNICNILSAFYFAKGFAFKNASPTVKMEDLNRK